MTEVTYERLCDCSLQNSSSTWLFGTAELHKDGNLQEASDIDQGKVRGNLTYFHRQGHMRIGDTSCGELYVVMHLNSETNNTDNTIGPEHKFM